MTRNVGTADRIARVVAAVALLIASVFVPASLLVKGGLMAIPAIYLLATSLVGTCLGYRLMGRSTCPLPRGNE